MIGVFDSGVGGLTVVRALMERLPFESIHYFGDTARVPYGIKSVQTISHYTTQIAEFLLEKRVKLRGEQRPKTHRGVDVGNWHGVAAKTCSQVSMLQCVTNWPES